MKKFLISLVVSLALLFTAYHFREPIVDALPIDQSGWRTDADGTRYLNEKGDPVTGWQEIDGVRYYFDSEAGTLVQGWLELSEGRYFLDDRGVMHTGWLDYQGNFHYFDEDGRLFSGLLTQGESRYYLDENGSPVSGIFPVEDSLCYISQNGAVLTGWVEVGENRCYLNEGGMLHTGWLEEGGKRYFLDEATGFPVTGWLEEEAAAFYLNPDGTLATGWTDVEGQTYYFDENGAPYTGWIEQEGQKYYFGEDGTPYSGWLEEDSKRYYLKENGTPAVGKLEIEGEAYFFSSTGMNFILVNPWNDLPEGFEVELVSAEGARLDPACQEALSNMLADCRAAGYYPMVASSYRSIADQTANLQRMVQSYLDQGYGYNQAYAAAIQIVAVPGTSEHHLGLAFDIVDSGYTKLNHQQANTATQKWLMENCWNYGFILRYPENSTDITGIIWEPWHYRYVGLELSKELQALGGIPLEVYIDHLTNDGTTCGGKLVPLESYR